MPTTAIHIAAAAALGGMAGLLGGLFGVGGGFLVIPLLGFFYGMDQQTAQGTVLISGRQLIFARPERPIVPKGQKLFGWNLRHDGGALRLRAARQLLG